MTPNCIYIVSMRPLILITNDDGLQAKGIKALTEELKTLGDIVVFAPDGPRSGMSGAITSHAPLRVKKEREETGITIYSCTGTPVDCVKLAINEILERKPDLLVSGINHGSNAAVCILYSGTMGAALEGCIFGIDSIGVSLTDHDHNADFTQAARYARIVAGKVLKEGLPKGVCLNVNIPSHTIPKGIRICTQTKGRWIKEFIRKKDQNGEEVFQLTGEFRNDEPNNEQTDEWALAQGYVSVVPSKIDMTSYQELANMKHWEK